MDRWSRTGLLIGAVSMIAVLVGCKGDKGPQGPAGGTQCFNCHTDNFAMEDYLLPIETQFAVSLHATGETFLRIDAPCAGCHTTEGFQKFVETGTGPAVEQSSHIGCFACHAPHTNQDFSLRKTGATTLAVGGGSYDKGPSNTCAMCHQLRVPSPYFTPDSITSSRWGGHHGPQANILSGQGLRVFTGGAAYPTNAKHNTGIATGCVNCHMAGLPSGALAGGHTFALAYETSEGEKLNSKGCTCHIYDFPEGDDDAIAFVDEAKEPFEAALNDTLAPRLLALKLLKTNTDGSYSTNDKRKDGTGRRVIWTADEMGAVFNYFALLEDKSGGVHNPVYARAALRATIDYANSHP